MTEQEFEDLENMTREELLGQIVSLRGQISELKAKNIDMGWQLNPDRSGGQFTQEELNHREGW